MAEKRITGRQLRHGTPEETLAPGQIIVIEKRDGKVFELKRVDAGAKSINTELDRLLQELPPEGLREKTDLSRVIIEDRE
jgi:hypothetical protein